MTAPPSEQAAPLFPDTATPPRLAAAAKGNGPWLALFAQTMTAALLVALLWPYATPANLGTWFASLTVLGILRCMVLLRQQKDLPDDISDVTPWVATPPARRIANMSHGLAWGLAPFLLLQQVHAAGGSEAPLAYVAGLLLMTALASQQFALSERLGVPVYALCILAPLALWLALDASRAALWLLVLVIWIGCFLVFSGLRTAKTSRSIGATLSAQDAWMNLVLSRSNSAIFRSDVGEGRRTRILAGLQALLGVDGSPGNSSTRDHEELVHPEDLAAMQRAIRLALEQSESYEVEYRLRDATGHYRWVQERGKVSHDPTSGASTIFGTLSDIDRMKRAEIDVRLGAELLEAQVAEQTAELRELVLQQDTTIANTEIAQQIGQIAWWTTDFEADQFIASSNFKTIAGFEPDRSPAWGKTYSRLFGNLDEQSQQSFLAAREFILENPGQIARTDLVYHHPVTERDLVLRMALRSVGDDAGKVLRLHGVIADITLVEDARQQNTQARNIETLGQLAIGLSHDFKNLLATIRLNLELALDGIDSQQSEHEFIEQAVAASNRGTDLIDRLMVFGRNRRLAPSTIEIDPFLQDLMKLVGRTLGENIRCRLELGAGGAHVSVDAGELQSAIMNLSLNARDAMPHGGVLTIHSGTEHVEQSPASQNGAAQPGPYIHVRVSDDGSGISEENLKRVADPFYTTKDNTGGSGLGLSNVRNCMTECGGFMKIDSREGQGTTVHLYFPLVAAGTRPITRVSNSADSSPSVRTSVLLVVEDEPSLRRVVCRQLAKLGYEVLEAGEAESALEILRSDRPIDLMISDIVMPGGMYGDQLAIEAKQLRPNLSVLLTTGHAKAASNIVQGPDGPPPVLRKPYGAQQLQETVSAILDRRSVA